MNKIEPKTERVLGSYLFALALYQLVIYQWPGGPPFILDPRAGIPVFLMNRYSLDTKVIYAVEWITAGWLLLMAAVLFFSGKLLKTYLVSEIILAAPSAYYIAILAIERGGHFAPGFKDLVLTTILFCVFSLVPIVLATERIFLRYKSAR